MSDFGDLKIRQPFNIDSVVSVLIPPAIEFTKITFNSDLAKLAQVYPQVIRIFYVFLRDDDDRKK